MRNCCDTGIRQPVPCENYAVCPFQDSGRASSSRRSLSRAMVDCGTSQPRSSVFRTCTGDNLELNRGAPAGACISSVDRPAKPPTPRKRIRTAQRLQAPQQGSLGTSEWRVRTTAWDWTQVVSAPFVCVTPDGDLLYGSRSGFLAPLAPDAGGVSPRPAAALLPEILCSSSWGGVGEACRGGFCNAPGLARRDASRHRAGSTR